MTIETNRLQLISLNGEQLKLLTEDIPRFESQLNCQYCGEEMEGELLRIFRKQIKAIENDPMNSIWHTFLLFKLKAEEKFIGSACFKSTPDDKGQVEIGYGINKSYQNLGYTTEAIKAMCEWALNQPSVTKIIAETEKGNIPSHKVLTKCNMKIYDETDECYWWELTKSTND